jgi:hypothetical protein
MYRLKEKMTMKRNLFAIFTLCLMFCVTAPAFADSVLHIWSCKLGDGKTTADAMKVSSDWLKAAKGMPGGKDLKLTLEFPLAADSGDGSFSFVLIVPDAKTWGVFMNDYDDSAAAKADDAWEKVASCSGSELWNSVDVQ